jgi:hypothetical protein
VGTGLGVALGMQATPQRVPPPPRLPQARKYQRTLSTFTFDRWASHRSTRRYVRHMSSLMQSGVLRGLAQPLLSVAGISVLVCLYEDLLQVRARPALLPAGWRARACWQACLLAAACRAWAAEPRPRTHTCRPPDAPPLAQDGTLPSYMPTFQLPLAPFELTSFALSLLLVFRTNTRHARPAGPPGHPVRFSS